MPRLHMCALAVTGILLASGCAGTSSGPVTSPPSPEQSSSPSAGVVSSAPAPSPSSDGQTIRITYASGKVSGVANRVQVKQGTKVSLIVTSDVADEVHLHGYDKHADGPAGGTITIAFTADLPGIYTVELERLKRRLVQLQVG